jgi:hypothetical protein
MRGDPVGKGGLPSPHTFISIAIIRILFSLSCLLNQMETIRNKISPRTQHFFNRLSQYLDTKLYYFGSVQRADYFPQGSDIDVDIFTDNEEATIIKIQNFLKVPKKQFKRFVWRLNTNDRVVYGHKIMYKDPEGQFTAEFSIYNEKVKDWILKEHRLKTFLPFYATYILVILKFLFYTVGIIPSYWYTYMKKFTLSTLIGLKYDEFVVIDLKSTF